MKALDLFCKAGGATKGLQEAGFHVTGVDIERQPNYCGDVFLQGDVFDCLLGLLSSGYQFDLIWASPPCQRYSMFSRNLGTSENHPDLIGGVRELLDQVGSPWIIENVVGAPLRKDVVLCGTMFGLRLIRHRVFETAFPAPVLVPPCTHRGGEIPVYGNGTPRWHREKLGRNITVAEQRVAMGIDWMTRAELTQAVPPAYSKYLARAWLTTAGNDHRL